MDNYDELLTATLDDPTLPEGQTSEKEVSEDYKVLTKGDDGSSYYPVAESFMATYNNPEKSSLDPKIFESMEVFTKDGKEYLGVKKENLTGDIDPYIDKYKVTYYPDEDKHNVFTSGSELSEIYKNIEVPESLKDKWGVEESDIEMNAALFDI